MSHTSRTSSCQSNTCLSGCASTVNSGFTIVELLIVIVVIGILAALTIVAYTGVTQKAVASSLQSDLANAAKQLALYQIDNMNYPASVTDCPTPAAANICLKASPNNSYSYTVVNTTIPQTFSLTAGNTNGTAWVVTNDSKPISTIAAAPGSQTFNYVGSIQTFTVPVGVTTLTITVKGAQGGSGTSYTGGLGASMSGVFSVTSGQVLKILAGQQGASNASYNAGGGGGGSFVTTNANAPLIIAGGGSGGGGNSSVSNGNPGLITSSGGNSSTSSGGSSGGGGGATSGSSGGGGLTGNGTVSGASGAGNSFINGGGGGAGGTCAAGGGFGGFGGGSGGEWCAQGVPGAGGGYSGGAGGASTSIAGAGGSYSNGTSQVNAAGTQSGNGRVLIVW